LVRAQIAVILSALAVVSGAAASAPLVPIASGHWAGHAWTLKGGDDLSTGQLRHCLQLSIDFPYTAVRPPSTPACWSIQAKPPAIAPSYPYYGISAASLAPGCPEIAWVIGPVVASAKEVEITLSTGATIRTPAIAPSAKLSQDVRYFAAQLPCVPRYTRSFTSLVGLDAAGKVVARLAMPGPH
jgi:hypothetical protein